MPTIEETIKELTENQEPKKPEDYIGSSVLSYIKDHTSKSSSETFLARGNGEAEKDSGPFEFEIEPYTPEELLNTLKLLFNPETVKQVTLLERAKIKFLNSLMITDIDPEDDHIIYTNIEKALASIIEEESESDEYNEINAILEEDIEDPEGLDGDYSFTYLADILEEQSKEETTIKLLKILIKILGRV